MNFQFTGVFLPPFNLFYLFCSFDISVILQFELYHFHYFFSCFAIQLVKGSQKIIHIRHTGSMSTLWRKKSSKKFLYCSGNLQMPVVIHTISANSCVTALATRFILSLLISPDGVIMPLSKSSFFMSFSLNFWCRNGARLYKTN